MPAPARFKPAKPPDEKLTVNLAAIDLGQIDLLVQEGFYASRTEFIRESVRRHLADRAEVIGKVASRHTLTLGIQHFSAADLRAVRASGNKLHIRVLGLACFADDVTPALATATIASITVLGALHASPELKRTLAGLTA